MATMMCHKITFTGDMDLAKEFCQMFTSDSTAYNSIFSFYKMMPIPCCKTKKIEPCALVDKSIKAFCQSDNFACFTDGLSKKKKDFIKQIMDEYHTLDSSIQNNDNAYKLMIELGQFIFNEYVNNFDDVFVYDESDIWGTYSDALDATITEKNDNLIIEFQTKWVVPKNIIKVFSLLFKIFCIQQSQRCGIEFRWEFCSEEMGGYSGEFFSDGKNEFSCVDDTLSEEIIRNINVLHDGNIDDTAFYLDDAGDYRYGCQDYNYDCENCKNINCWQNEFNERCKEPLGTSFISKNFNNLNWHIISLYQPLSETEIAIFSEKIDWKLLVKNKNVKLSDWLLKKYASKLHSAI